jgi:serine O-acetyltransferase
MKKNQLNDIVKKLSAPESYNKVYHVSKRGTPMPDHAVMQQIVNDLRDILFPGFFGATHVTPENMEYHIGLLISKVNEMLTEQIVSGLCFNCHPEGNETMCSDCSQHASDISMQFINRLPEIRDLLATDVEATYNGDPASKNFGEIIFCYPGIRAIANYRIAHELYKLEVPLLPRIITEMAHFETGIDIHPGAAIGSYFAIDHGTGVVIGETTIIGNHVKIYQGVTLGAKSFPLDENGNPIKGIPRHPVVEDNVIIYAEATLLGRITIGKNSVIGGNMWIINDVPENTRLAMNREG